MRLLYEENIKDMGDTSARLMQLRPVVFNYKSEIVEGPRTNQFGLIAEEVAEVYPDLVDYNPETGVPDSVYYEQINVMLFNEVQKQQRLLLAQKEEVYDLKKRISKLESLLCKQVSNKEPFVAQSDQGQTLGVSRK